VPVLDDLLHDVSCDVDWDGKSYPLVASGAA
jgi:hypothetical protein